MGRYLNEVKRKSETGARAMEGAKEMGRRVISEVRKKASILDGLPDDVDEEVIRIRQEVRESVKNAGRKAMDTQVKTQMETGKKELQDSSDIAKDQIEKSSRIIDGLHSVESTGELGSQKVAEGVRITETSKKEHENARDANVRTATEAMNEFNRQISELVSL